MKRYLLLAAFAIMACLLVWAWLALWLSRSGPDLQDVETLRRAGFRPSKGRPERPKDLPKAARPIATVRGRVSFGSPALPVRPHGAGAESGPAGAPLPDRDPSAPARPCGIVPADLAGGCKAEIVSLGGKPYARLFWDGAVRTPTGIVTRGPEQVDEVLLEWSSPPPPKRTLVGLDVGLVGTPGGVGYEVGGRLCPKVLAGSGRLGEARLCAYARAEVLPGDVRGAVGASLLFGVGPRD